MATSSHVDDFASLDASRMPDRLRLGERDDAFEIVIPRVEPSVAVGRVFEVRPLDVLGREFAKFAFEGRVETERGQGVDVHVAGEDGPELAARSGEHVARAGRQIARCETL